MNLGVYFLPFLWFSAVAADNMGWSKYFVENPTEFHDRPLEWEMANDIPDWVTGTYVRNGPAQISFKSERRIFTSWLDGFAKLHSFKFNGNRVLFSGKMMETPLYKESVWKGELVPQFTMNKFRTAEEEWSWSEKISIGFKMMSNSGYDNSNPGLWRIGAKDKEKGIHMAVTDFSVSTQFNISTLATVAILKPKMFPVSLSGTTHWMREPGTDNSININNKKGKGWVVSRYRPEHSFQEPEEVAVFKAKIDSMIHSFSITENYAVFFFYPVTVDLMGLWGLNFHVLEGMKNMPDKPTQIFIVDLKTGAVTERETDYTFSYHHVNAYETKDGKIITDIIGNQFDGIHEYVKLDNMLNPPKVLNESDVSRLLFERYVIDLKSDNVQKIVFPDQKPDDRYLNHFDFPTVNEDYRGKPYCISYGWSSYGYSRMTLVKRNLCNHTQSRTWAVENHYSSEMYFVSNPIPTSEDDGVLVTIVFDGTKEQSYLLLLDAKTMTPLNKAYLPHNIPWSAHGIYFPEAQF